MLAAMSARAEVDLVVTGATVFDTAGGDVHAGRTIVIDSGRIVSVVPDGDGGVPLAERVIDAAGRLVTPGFIDVHHHTGTILGDSVTAGGGDIERLTMMPDSIRTYRERFARAYLPWGVTTVREAGGDDRYLEMRTAWMKPVPWAPDFYACGGALVSHEEGRVPYAGHNEVMSPEDAAARVRGYHDLGIEYIKLYWRLREPELVAALDEANRLGMHAFAHIDFGIVSIGRALDLGVRDFAHAYTLARSVLSGEEIADVWENETQAMLHGRPDAAFFVQSFEMQRRLGRDNPDMLALIDRMASLGATMTPTLHVFANAYPGLSWFRSPPKGKFNDTSELETEIIDRGREGFAILQSCVKAMCDRGIRLNLGTDCQDPGRAALSEILLLHECGIPMADVLRIATINGARTMHVDDQVGSIEPGKKAHLIIFDENPLDDPRAVLNGRTVIKDGVVYGG
jgi:cytosine/adenosine deaminase-related metal-dependent hydrolase